jgi:hypothetical protein
VKKLLCPQGRTLELDAQRLEAFRTRKSARKPLGMVGVHLLVTFVLRFIFGGQSKSPS